MCGICGFNWEEKELISRMCNAIAHRGPDQHGSWTDSEVSLGHLRLSILDLSEKGRQPMQDDEGTVTIVFNGEIYNYIEIRERLEKKGYKFRSNTDTEVIIYAYKEYGEKCIEQFNGMFAFAIWDSEKEQFFIARDRMGIKPLYYYWKDGKFIFASELKSILQNEEIKRSFDREGLRQMFLYAHNICGSTLLENFWELLPGHYMIFKDGKITISRYWQLATTENTSPVSYEKLHQLLKDAVERRMISDVSLGATLSGGIDSSMIVALMSKLRDEPPKTFTLGIEDYDEDFLKSRIVSEHCSTEHVEKTIGYDEITKAMPKILWHMEYPFGRPAVLLTYFTSKAIKPQMTVSLVGDGADEVFAGYNRYFDAPNITDPEKIHKTMSGYFNSRNYLQEFVSADLNMEKYRKEELNTMFSRYFNSGKDSLNQNLLMDIEMEIPGIQFPRVDKMSMAFAVEMRVPFIDHTLVEYCMNIDPKFKINQENKKYMLQKIALDYLPKEIALRKKLPFGFPLEYYFKNGFCEVVDGVFDKEVGIKGLVNIQKIRGLIDSIKKGSVVDDNAYRQLLFMTNLELFQRMFNEGERVNSL